jgi:BrnA antitoxin of type II toxin-antitoxin system
MKKEYDFSGGKRGALLKAPGKTRITIYLDNDILEAFREKGDAAGRGYQTMINDALRAALGDEAQPIDIRTLRRILREEMPQYRVARSGRKRR